MLSNVLIVTLLNSSKLCHIVLAYWTHAAGPVERHTALFDTYPI